MLDRVTLKNVKFHKGHDGMDGLNADIYIDKVKVAHVYDDARGGCFEYDVLGSIDSKQREINKKLFKELEDYIDSLPEEQMEYDGKKYERDGNPVMMKPDMDSIINDLVEEFEKEKSKKRLKKDMEKKIVFGKPNGNSYKLIGYKSPLKAIAMMKGGKEAIQKLVNRVKGELKEGEEILNDNLAELGIEV